MPAPRTASRTATIADLLAEGGEPLFSFEFFPPKDEAAEQQLWQTLRELQRLRPDFVSVTYGANGSNRDRTIRITRDIERETGLRTMAHLTCVSQPVSQLRHVLGPMPRPGSGTFWRSAAICPVGRRCRGRHIPTGCRTPPSWSGW